MLLIIHQPKYIANTWSKTAYCSSKRTTQLPFHKCILQVNHSQQTRKKTSSETMQTLWWRSQIHREKLYRLRDMRIPLVRHELYGFGQTKNCHSTFPSVTRWCMLEFDPCWTSSSQYLCKVTHHQSRFVDLSGMSSEQQKHKLRQQICRGRSRWFANFIYTYIAKRM